MKKFIFIMLAMMALGVSLQAQKLSMRVEKELHCVETSQDAQINKVADPDGKPCALLKITLSDPTQANYFHAVPGGFVAVSKTSIEPESGDIWYWLPSYVTNLTLKCKDHEDFKINVKLESGKVYRMSVSLQSRGEFIQTVEMTSGYVKFSVFPKRVNVYWGITPSCDQFESVVDGMFSTPDMFEYGKTFYYKIEDPEGFYETLSSSIVFNGNSQIKPVSLVPAYNFLTVVTQPHGATIFIDDKFVENPYKVKLKKGNHKIIAKLTNYHQKTTNVLLDGSQSELTENLVLMARFARIKLSCIDRNAQITLDESKTPLANGEWEGDIPSGTHKVTAHRGSSYKSQSISITVKDNQAETHIIPAPIPLMGILDLSSSPSGCNVYLDGSKLNDVTPMAFKCLSGKHTVEFRKEGYIKKIREINVEYGKKFSLKETLEKGKLKYNVSLSLGHSSEKLPYDVSLLIDGNEISNAWKSSQTWSGIIEEGEHIITSRCKNCYDGTLTLNVNGGTRAIVPSPTIIKGKLFIKTNADGTTLMGKKLDNEYSYSSYGTIGKSSTAISLPIGTYYFYTSGHGRYHDSEKVSVNVCPDKKTEVNIHMKKDPWVSIREYYFPSVFVNFLYGFTAVNNVYTRYSYQSPSLSDHHIGGSFAWVNKHFGLNLSYMHALFGRDMSISASPLLRLTNSHRYSYSVDLQIYAGPLFTMNCYSSWAVGGDVGLRLGFDHNDCEFGWWNIYAGCQFSKWGVIPTVGVSLFPFKLFAIDGMYDEVDEFAYSFLDFLLAYNESTSAAFGLNYTFLNCHLGGYMSMLYSLDQDFIISAGPAFRLTPDGSGCDLQIYGGIGYFRGLNVDAGIRFGWRSESKFSKWDFGLGCMYSVNDGRHLPMLTMGICIPLVPLTFGMPIWL